MPRESQAFRPLHVPEVKNKTLLSGLNTSRSFRSRVCAP